MAEPKAGFETNKPEVKSVPTPVATTSAKSKADFPLSFSLKGQLNKKDDDTPTDNKGRAIVLDEPVTEQSVEAAWKDFAGQQDDAHLKNTMLNFLPSLKGEALIEVLVSNPGQEEKLKERLPDILAYFTQQLRNNTIKIEVKIDEDIQEKRPFLPQEKYQFMSSRNPVLKDLVSEFNLRLD